MRENISDQAFSRLKQQLLERAWKAGEKIPSENELADRFGVSRVTIRNALQKLSALGLIETRFGEGSFVCEIRPENAMDALIPVAFINDQALQEILQFRRMTEGPACGEACLLTDAEKNAELRGIYEKMQQSVHDLKQFSRYDFQFHQRIIRMTENSILIRIYSIIQEMMEHAFDRIVSARGTDAGLHYHGLILEAFEEGNPQKASGIMQEHMTDLYESYLRDFKEN